MPQPSTGTTEPPSPEPRPTTALVLALLGGMGTHHQDEPIEIKTTTSDGLPLILSLAPGYSREDVFAELPAIRRTAQEAHDRLRDS